MSHSIHLVVPIEQAFIRQKAAAKYLGLSEQGFIKLLRRGEGPPCYKKGRSVFFEIAALREWMFKPTSVSSEVSHHLEHEHKAA